MNPSCKTITELSSIASESIGILKALTWHTDTIDENVREGLCPTIDALEARLRDATQHFDEIQLVEDDKQ